jgi:hypothetical protein
VYQAMVWDQCSQCPIDSKKSHDYCDTFGVFVPWVTCLRIMKALSVHIWGFGPLRQYILSYSESDIFSVRV